MSIFKRKIETMYKDNDVSGLAKYFLSSKKPADYSNALNYLVMLGRNNLDAHFALLEATLSIANWLDDNDQGKNLSPFVSKTVQIQLSKRWEAMKALSIPMRVMGTGVLVNEVIKHLDKPDLRPSEFDVLVYLLGHSRDVNAYSLLIKYLKIGDVGQKSSAAAALGYFGSSDAVADLIDTFLNNAAEPESNLHITLGILIIEAIGRLKNSSALPFLEGLVDSSINEYINESARAVIEIIQSSKP